jgi:hypothetical protein
MTLKRPQPKLARLKLTMRAVKGTDSDLYGS